MAVVGANSHGKSYLLTDIIHAFERLGFVSRDLPLSFPYSGFAGYFNLINKDGCMGGTSRYACRHSDHYGAVLDNDMKHERIDIEFLNIPGESFVAGIGCVAEFGDLKRRLEQAGKVFKVTTWSNTSGQEAYVVEPSDELRRERNLSTPDYNPTGDLVSESAYKQDYQEYVEIFRRLRRRMMKPVSSSSRIISGRELMQNFFVYQPDSMMRAIYEVWESTPLGESSIRQKDFLDKQYIKDFYFYTYCLDATDIVVCDKLFFPPDQNASQNEIDGANGFVQFTQELDTFLNGGYNSNRPNVYLAFRCADQMLDEVKTNQLVAKLHGMTPYERNNAVYSVFLHNLLLKIDTKNCYRFPADRLQTWLGIKGSTESLQLDILADIDKLKTLTRTPLASHVASRMGDYTSGFWKLLMTVGQGNKVSKLYNQQDLPLAPHVFFTSTPIDSNYHIYHCDSKMKNQRFIRETDTGAIEALNVVGQYLSFGTTQLCIDILRQNGVKSIHFLAGTLLNRMFASIKN